MTDNEKILNKILNKAEKGGYREHMSYFPLLPHTRNGKKITKAKLKELAIRICMYHVNDIIFSHSFNKAYWGEDLGYCCFSSTHGQCEGWHKATSANHRYPRWMHHLQIMVLEEEPLKYLESFL